MNVQVEYGQTITDVVLNATGLIDNWGQVLDANNFDTWTPDFEVGQTVEIPDGIANDLEAVRALSVYPLSNSSSETLYGIIGQIFKKLLGLTPVQAPKILPQVQDTNTYYTVKYGETIGDVLMNATGSIDNWQLVLDANGLDWAGLLVAGQVIAIPNTVKEDLNSFRALQEYPVNNNSEKSVYDQISAIFGLLGQDWILATGYWNDLGHWHDTSYWID